MKDYLLYLDESGDFEADLKRKYKNECIVGGYIVEIENHDDQKNVKRYLINSWKEICLSDEKSSDNEIIRKIKHSTELNDHKAEMVEKVLKYVVKQGRIVIFENKDKSKIIDGSTTYINILCDGVIQLLADLIHENNGNKFGIQIIAGKRKNINSGLQGDEYDHIVIDEYKKRINEQIEIERIRNSFVYKHDFEFQINLDFDKANWFLILCDYICNFFFTRDATIFDSYREKLLRLIEKDGLVYSFTGGWEKSRVRFCLDIEAYGALLYQICTGGIVDDSLNNEIIDFISSSSQEVVDKALESLRTFIHPVVENRDHNAIKYIDRAEVIVKDIESRNNSIHISKFTLDLLLYKIACAEHIGDIVKIGELYQELFTIMPQIALRIDNLQYIFMIYNRYAVYLYDVFDIEKEEEMINNILREYDYLRSAFQSISSVNKDLFCINNYPLDEMIISDQFAKLLGTQVQCKTYLMKSDRINYTEAIHTSDAAIRNFGNNEKDLRRQYQYRAEIEAEEGNLDLSLKYFLKGFGIDKIDDIFSPEFSQDFGYYHLSYIYMKCINCLDPVESKRLKNILKKFRKNKDRLFTNTNFPIFLTMGNLGHICATEGNLEQASSYYSAACKWSGEDMSIFVILKSMLLSDYIVFLKKNGMDYQNEKEALEEMCDKLQEEELPGSMANVVKMLEDTLEIDDIEFYHEYARKRSY